MSDKPIIFSGAMVRALLDGRKTMTRRLLKPQPEGVSDRGVVYYDLKRPPYAVGDRLYVRESYAPRYFDGGKHAFQADWTGESADCVPEPKWTPAIHQFKRDSRLTLTVTAVKVERLQDITEEDAKAEGMRYQAPTKEDYDWYEGYCEENGGDPHEPMDGVWKWDEAKGWGPTPQLAFRFLWDSLNAKRAPWDSNPWVVAVSFMVEKINIDALKEAA